MHLATKNVAIVHDWLPVLAGGERVVEQMVRLCPNSHIYTLFDFLSEEDRLQLSQGRPITTSSLNKLPRVEKYYRYLLLSCTRAIEEFDLTKYDVVLSSSAALAKGVLTSPGQPHIAYVHSPARYAWDLSHEYIGSLGGFAGGLKRLIASQMMHKFRIWDMRTPPSIDVFVANSEFIRQRIWKIYRRDAQVIYPPVDVSAFTPSEDSVGDFYLTVSRMVPYKRIPLIVEAFNQRPSLKLKVIGDGPDMAKIKAIAGPNIEIMGYQSFEVMREQMRRAKAFVFAALEDFGISPVESQACGTPVIALGKGGTAETVRPIGSDQPTGAWFSEQTVDSLLEAIDLFERDGQYIKRSDCRQNALRFSPERFREELGTLISKTMAK